MATEKTVIFKTVGTTAAQDKYLFDNLKKYVVGLMNDIRREQKATYIDSAEAGIPTAKYVRAKLLIDSVETDITQ